MHHPRTIAPPGFTWPALAGRAADRPAARATGVAIELDPTADLGGHFQAIWETNLWGAAESRSGLGSEPAASAWLERALPALLDELGVRHLVDAPCGDGAWIARSPLALDTYHGIDLVPAAVDAARAHAGPRPGWRWSVGDITSTPLPAADAVLCRDCLVHLSFANIQRALANIAASDAAWLVTTTFIRLDENDDCADGDWRPLNLERPPFDLPRPAVLLIEGDTECDGAYADKCLGIWSIDDLRRP